jgi:tetratricopeptide (TPR) repeat protein
LFGATEQLCLERLEADRDNLRTALSWYVDAGRPAEALRLVGALWWLWFSHGHLEEGCSWVRRALELDDAPTLARVRALRAGSHLSWWRGDFAGCRAYNVELQRCAEAIGDAWGLAWAHMAFGAVEMFHDPPRALGLFEQSRRGFEALDCEWEAGYTCQVTGGARWFGGDEQAAGEAYEQAVEIFERLGHRSVLASARRGAGLMAARGGHAARGAAMCEQALRLSDAIGDRAGSAQALNFLASISRDNADYATAVARYRDALSLAHQVGELWATCWAFDGLGEVACAVGDPKLAARLLAHSGRLASRAGYHPPPHERRLREGDIATVRRVLGEEAFELASTEGALMSVSAAVALAAAFAGRHA